MTLSKNGMFGRERGFSGFSGFRDGVLRKIKIPRIGCNQRALRTELISAPEPAEPAESAEPAEPAVT
jgi:hypothetical protein